MARRQNDDSFLNEELEAAFNFGDDLMDVSNNETFDDPEQNEIQEEENELPGQLAVDVYETEDKLFVKARTAGVNKNDLDVSLSDEIKPGTIGASQELISEYPIMEGDNVLVSFVRNNPLSLQAIRKKLL